MFVFFIIILPAGEIAESICPEPPSGETGQVLRRLETGHVYHQCGRLQRMTLTHNCFTARAFSSEANWDARVMPWRLRCHRACMRGCWVRGKRSYHCFLTSLTSSHGELLACTAGVCREVQGQAVGQSWTVTRMFSRVVFGDALRRFSATEQSTSAA